MAVECYGVSIQLSIHKVMEGLNVTYGEDEGLKYSFDGYESCTSQTFIFAGTGNIGWGASCAVLHLPNGRFSA